MSNSLTGLENVRCGLCNSDSHTLLFVGRDQELKNPGSFKVVRCTSCGLIYLNPRPTQGALAGYYNDSYEPYQATGTKKGTGVLRKWLYVQQIHDLKNLVTPGSSLLEIGCGSGRFTHMMQEYLDVRVSGIELNPLAAETARTTFGLRVHTGTLHDAKLADASFDVVVMKHVLEHVPDPAKELAEIHRILKKGGIAVIWVPNARSVERTLFRSRWRGYDVPRHFYTFSVTTLTKFFCKARFSPVRFDCSSEPNDWIGCLRYWFADHSCKSLEKWATNENYLLLALFYPFSLCAALVKFGGRMRFIAKKT